MTAFEKPILEKTREKQITPGQWWTYDGPFALVNMLEGSTHSER